MPRLMTFLLTMAIGTLVLGVASVNTAMAAAWTRGEGQFLFLIPAEYYVATEQFDNDGDRVDRRRFTQVEIGPYLEYGITDFLTVGAQPKFRRITLDTDAGELDNSGLADADLFTRLRLWHEGEAAFSVQGLVKIPIQADEEDALPLGFEQIDTEVSAAFGNRHPLDFGTIFYNLEVGFRKRFETPADEVHGDVFIGWTDGTWTALVQSLNTAGISSELGTTEVLTSEPEYTRFKAQVTIAYRLSDQASVLAGGSTTYAGTNVGAGNSGFLGVSWNF